MPQHRQLMLFTTDRSTELMLGIDYVLAARERLVKRLVNGRRTSEEVVVCHATAPIPHVVFLLFAGVAGGERG